ncbi:MAG: BlaI/MecI/CopY family transcriptional regulator [Tissierellales bacterium]
MVSRITDSEVLVMRILWKARNELTITHIRTSLEKTTDWDSSTIKRLIRRLVNKGVVEATKKEVYYYRSLITEDEYVPLLYPEYEELGLLST